MSLSDLTGHTFARLTVVSCAGTKTNARGRSVRTWLCRCVCGKEITVPTSSLSTGNTKSCGCLALEMAGARLRTHGATYTRAHSAWRMMRARCMYPSVTRYDRYGGRGIKVCDRWQNSFENFLADMGEPPSGMSLERIDNDGNYEPGNCKWATQTEQCRNRRNSRRLLHEGRDLTVEEWSEVTGIHRRTIMGRIRLGWPVEKVLTAPVQPATYDRVAYGIKKTKGASA